VRAPGLARGVVLAVPLLHQPVEEAHEHRAVLSLSVGMRPAPEGRLHVLAIDRARIAVPYLVPEQVEGVAVSAFGAGESRRLLTFGSQAAALREFRQRAFRSHAEGEGAHPEYFAASFSSKKAPRTDPNTMRRIGVAHILCP
jgi:hypothetical protein